MNILDMSLFALLNAGAGTPMWRIHIAAVISNFLPAFMVLVLAGLALAQPERQWRVLWAALLSLLIAWVSVNLFRYWMPLPRPAALDLGIQWVAQGQRGSFPSMHATGAFAVAMSLCLERRDRWALLFLLAASAVAWSRLYLGLHFPTDVFAGAVLGTLLAFVGRRLVVRRPPPPAPGDVRRVLP